MTAAQPAEVLIGATPIVASSGETIVGVLSPDVHVDAFYSAIEGQVLPRLARLGVGGESMWSRRYRADA